MAEILVKLGMRLLSEAFVAKMIVHGGRALADSTENKLDNKMVDAVAEALGVDG